MSVYYVFLNKQIKKQTQRLEQHNMTQMFLDEKKSELLSTETQLQEVEENFITTLQIRDNGTNDQYFWVQRHNYKK